ncbi:hypothetical protein DL990_21080 [Amycolatopsis sp. WAC 01416]|uniref:hypothetical protein n=1 Tax=Amycolatopsis sp. WAC 01416 TaxID=2203196 RepID=UPI000F7AFF14|nr:hypothetical protein DL990_21080 [Amycolatopsis sp. WAC 01416]
MVTMKVTERSTDVEVEVLDPRTAAEPEGWRGFLRRARLRPVWEYEVLRREAWMAKNPAVLAVLRRGEEIVGAFTVMVCRSWRAGDFAPLSVRRGRFRPRWAEAYLWQLSGYPAVALDERLDGVERREAVRRFERALCARLGPGLLGVIYRAMNPELLPALEGRGRMSREIDPAAVLANEYSTVDDWERALGDETRKTLRDLREDEDLRTEAASARQDLDCHELAVLLNAHRTRQDERAWAGGQRSRFGGLHMDTRSPIAPSYLDALVRRPDVITRTYRDGSGRLLGFGTVFDADDGCALHQWAALPSARGGRKGLYVDFYARGVEHMITQGRPELTAGRAMLENKAAFGFGTRSLVSVAVPRPVLGR